jgi:hypothetical protein
MKKVLFFPLLLSPVVFVYAGISTFVFISDSQVISPGELSKAIIIQSQNSSSGKELTTETFDINYSSSSGTGEFLGSTGKPASKVMSKNTGSKTFYYRDKTLGNFTITLVLTGRDSKKSFSIKQNIIIGTLPKTETIKPIIKTAVSKELIKTEEAISTREASLEANVVVFTAPEHKGFWSELFAWPIKIIGFTKHLFLED